MRESEVGGREQRNPIHFLPAFGLLFPVLPLILSVIAGSADAIGFLWLNGLFTAHVTGNIVVLAAHIIAGDPAILSLLLSVPVFMLALVLTRLLAGALEAFDLATLGPLLLLQLLLLVGFLVLGVTASQRVDANETLAVAAGMLGVSAMAVQNVLVQISLPGVPSTAAMTTNVTHFMTDIGAWLVARDRDDVAKARRRAKITWPVILGFTVGCGLGAAGEADYGPWSLALPTGLALLAVVIGLSGTVANAAPSRRYPTDR